MRILIDGYNLLHASTIVPPPQQQGSLAATRGAVLNFLVARLPPSLARQTTVVFDKGTERGLPAEATHGPLTVRFAIHHAEADDLLEQLISAHHAPRRLTVVSSDHRVQRAARRRRACAVDSEVWLKQLTQHGPPAAAEPPSPEASTAGDWRDEFADLDLAALEREVEAADTLDQQATEAVQNAMAEEADDDRPGELSEDDQLLFPPGYAEDVLAEDEDEEGPSQ